MQTHDMKIRLPATMKRLLAARAACNERSLNAEVNNILRCTMKLNPLRIIVCRAATESDALYNVVMGDDERVVFQTKNLDDAFVAARGMFAELGFPRVRANCDLARV